MRKRGLITDILLTCLLVISSLACLSSGMRLPCSSEIYWAAPFTAALFCLIWNIRNRFIPWLIAAGSIVLCFCINFVNLKYLWYKMSILYSRGYYFLFSLVPGDTSDFPYEVPEKILLPAFIFLAILFSFIISMSLRYLKKTLPAALISSLGILPCLLLTDTIPGTVPMALFAASFLTLILSSRSRNSDSAGYNRSVIYTGIFSVLLSAAVFLNFPEDDFEETKFRFHNFTLNAVNIDLNIPEKVKNRFKRHFKETNVDLESLTDLPDDYSTVMTVKTSYPYDMYLRGNAYSDFDGSGWKNGSSYDDVPAVFSPAALNESDQFADIKTYSVENVIYTPYYISYSPVKDMISNDSFITNSEGLDNYSFRFNNASARSSYSSEYIRALGLYDEWVRSNCLDLPDETREAVLSWLYEHDTSFLESDDLYLKSKSIAELVSKSASYSRSPSPVNKDKDFCEWFLRDAEKGYCSHYATATAALLRAVGIPARYATGYIVNAETGPDRIVTGMQSHAWVEAWIYDKWVVIEATPANSVTTAAAPQSSPSPTPVPEATTTDAPTNTPEPEATLTPISTATPAATAASAPGNTIQPTESAVNDHPADSAAVFELTGKIAAVILILLILPVRRLIILAFRKKKTGSKDINTRARLNYRHIIRLRKYTRTPVPVKVRDSARKAAFSNKKISEDELNIILAHLEKEKKKLEGAKPFKRIFYKYILVLY